MKFYNLILILLLISLTSCSSYYYPNLLMTNLTENDFRDLKELQVAPSQNIKKGDQFNILVYPNNGEALLIYESDIRRINQEVSNIIYYVNEHGFISLPLIGNIFVEGLTLETLKDTLTKLYSSYITDPYIFLGWANKKVYVFSQGSGSGTAVPFSNSYITLLDAITSTGGIGNEAYSNKIIIARATDTNKEDFAFYKINLQDKENLYLGNIYLRDGDMIYVLPKKKFVDKALAEINPYISLFNTLLIIIQFFIL